MDTTFNSKDEKITIKLEDEEMKKYGEKIRKELSGFYYDGKGSNSWTSKNVNELHGKTIEVLNYNSWLADMTEECKQKVRQLLKKKEDKENEVSISYDEENKYFIMKCSYENRAIASNNGFKWNNNKKVWYSINLKDVELLTEYMDEETKSKIEEFREIEKSIQFKEEVSKLVNRKNENLKLNGFPLISKIEISKDDTLEKAQDKINIEAFHNIGLFIRDKIDEERIHHLLIDDKISFLEKYQNSLLSNLEKITDENEISQIKDGFYIMISEVFPEGNKEDIKELTELYLENKKIDRDGMLIQNLDYENDDENLWNNPWAQSF